MTRSSTPTPGYQGAERRPHVADDPHLSQVEFRIAARKSKLAAMAGPDRAAESRQASVRAKVEHVFRPLKTLWGFAKTRYRGLAKNANRAFAMLALINLNKWGMPLTGEVCPA